MYIAQIHKIKYSISKWRLHKYTRLSTVYKTNKYITLSQILWQVIKNIETITRCRDSRVTKSKKKKQGRGDHVIKAVKHTTLLHIFFIIRVLWNLKDNYSRRGIKYSYSLVPRLSPRATTTEALSGGEPENEAR